MGLDMYLTAETEEDLGYWRKANAIHLWFVRECQSGIDECQETVVDRSKLQELKQLCCKVIANSKLVDGNMLQCIKYDSSGRTPVYEAGQIIEDPTTAIELLPTGDGFFFGNTHYDERYYVSLQHTITIIDKALSLPEDVEIIYQSSW